MKFLRSVREVFIVCAPFLASVAVVEALVFLVPVRDPGTAFLIGMVCGCPGMLGSMALWGVRH